MDPETNSDALQTTLDELSHLLINPSRLTILNDSEVGSGGYGEVYLATLDGTSKVAIKQLRIIPAGGTKARAAIRLARELKIWEKAKHPNVLKLVGYYLSDNYSCAQLVSLYMENGNIIDYMKSSQAEIETRLSFIQGITLGVAYLHSCDPPICHGDLKPANVLISNKPDAVLCDFGLATFVEDSGTASGLTTSRSIKGSLRYMSPQLFLDAEAKHTLESDIWAWACTIFEIVTGVTPYADFKSDGSIIASLVRGNSPGSMELLGRLASKVDTPSRSMLLSLQTLIPECWNMDPRKRPSSSGMLNRLNTLGLENSNVASTPLTRAEEKVNLLVKDDGAPTQPSRQLTDQTKGAGSHQVKVKLRRAIGWVTEDASGPEVVLRLSQPDGNCYMSVAPSGKWLATSFYDGGSTLWNLENGATPQLGFPSFERGMDFQWAPDSRYLACFGGSLYIWSTDAQSGKEYLNEPPKLVGWFSDGENLAVLPFNDERVYIVNSKSGDVRMCSIRGSMSHTFSPRMATFPIDRVAGRKIVFIANCQSTRGSTAQISGWVRKKVSAHTRRVRAVLDNVIVYDADTQKVLAQIPQESYATGITISKNSEFALLSCFTAGTKLLRLGINGHGDVTCDVQTTLRFGDFIWGLSCPHFGGDNDECIIAATSMGEIIVWDTQSSKHCQTIEGLLPSNLGGATKTAYCPANEEGGPRLLLYGHNNQEVVIWKWWKKSSE